MNKIALLMALSCSIIHAQDITFKFQEHFKRTDYANISIVIEVATSQYSFGQPKDLVKPENNQIVSSQKIKFNAGNIIRIKISGTFSDNFSKMYEKEYELNDKTIAYIIKHAPVLEIVKKGYSFEIPLLDQFNKGEFPTISAVAGAGASIERKEEAAQAKTLEERVSALEKEIAGIKERLPR